MKWKGLLLMDRQTTIEFLIMRPVDYARLLGFTKLGRFHNCIDCLWDFAEGGDNNDETASS